MTNRRPRLTQPDQMPTPVVDDHSATVLDEAIDTLGELRTPYWLGDSAVRLHALASLLKQWASPRIVEASSMMDGCADRGQGLASGGVSGEFFDGDHLLAAWADAASAQALAGS